MNLKKILAAVTATITIGATIGVIPPENISNLNVMAETDESSNEYTDSQGIIYNIYSDHAEICGTVSYINSNNEYQHDIKAASIPSSVQGVPVTEIDDTAFAACTSLLSVNIPNSIVKIDSYAFAECTSLKSVVIPDSVKSISYRTFLHCYSLSSVKIPNSVTSIYEEAFYGCSSLTSITIPKSVTKIGIGAFGDCKSLTDIYYTGSKNEWNIINFGFDDSKSIFIYYDDGYGSYRSATIHYNSTEPATTIYNIKIIIDQSDPNNDTKIDSGDATAILIDYAKYLLNGERTLTNEQADSNGDGVVDSADATNILIYYANKLLEP